MNQIDPVQLAAIGDAAVIIDVREAEEYEAAHVPGARSVPLSRFAAGVDLPDARPLYVMCHSGGRSAQATDYLNMHGVDAIDVAGGITGWMRAGLPVLRGVV